MNYRLVSCPKCYGNWPERQWCQVCNGTGLSAPNFQQAKEKK